MPVRIKRIYEPYLPADGYRILVDRLWPRGIKKEGGHIDKWLKEVAPSTALRKWFNHEPKKWEEFRRRYHAELTTSAALDELSAAITGHKTVSLLFAAKDPLYHHAIVLQQFVNEHL